MPAALSDLRMVGSVDQENASAVAVDPNLIQNRLQVPALGGVAVGDADDLETVDFDLLIGEHTDSGGGDGVAGIFESSPNCS